MGGSPVLSLPPAAAPPSDTRGRRSLVRPAHVVTVVLIVVLGIALAPFALNERLGSGAVSDNPTARPADSPNAPTVLAGSVDAVADAARARGYECTIPEIRTIRGCTRSANGYSYELWLQGTDTYLTSQYLSVSANYRTETRGRWIEEMGTVLRDLGTDQARRITEWVDQNADSPRSDAQFHIDGLPVSFYVRTHEYTKETFGGVLPECGRNPDDISSCEP